MPMQGLQKLLGDRLLHEEPLARYTAARLGGPAEWLYIARDSLDELVEVVTHAWETGLPVRVLGGGANTLVSDYGVRGLIIINHLSEVTFGDWHDGRNVSALSGTGLSILARKCKTQGLAGLEWGVSVPGSVGGAIVNNAGAHGGDISQTVCDIAVLDAERGPQLLTNTEMGYAYRHSALKSRADRRFLVLMATFALTPDTPEAIQARMDSYITHRKSTQPSGASLGSIFKNPEGDYAGRLIESCGLKGYRIGGAHVSERHGNFFINDGKAQAADYYHLIMHIRDEVHRLTGVLLEMEVELIGERF